VGVELPRQSDLVEAKSGVARRAVKRRQGVLAALMLGDSKRDPLLGLPLECAVTELGAKPRVTAQRCGRPRQNAQEVR
jgi:hypothetical protein